MSDPEATRASVLIPIQLQEDGLPRLTLIRRSHAVTHHSGQIAFPGGRFEPGIDDGLLAAALREAKEEIGLDATDVRVIGALPETRTLTSNFLVSPFIGLIPADYPFRPDPIEVAEIIEIPLAHFDLARGRESLRWVRGNVVVEVPAVHFRDDWVWGATLNIIEELWLHRESYLALA